MAEVERPEKPAPKILLVDDDREFLRVYRELLLKENSQSEVRTAETGQRALALLEAETFDVLICDLKMAKVDGFQVLAIVRRKFPQLRTMVLTGLADEQFRARAYAIGVDLFLQKPTTPEETQLFLECIEALLGASTATGFRGLQSKSLVDIIQLECLSLSSSVLRVRQGVQEGRVWFSNGDIIDAVTADLTGVLAFQRILEWKNGSFEVLPPEPERERKIFSAYHTLLLETAHVLDESNAPAGLLSGADAVHAEALRKASLAELARTQGVEFILATSEADPVESWGVENAEKVAEWTRRTVGRFQKLGESLELGEAGHVNASTNQRRVILAGCGDRTICLGLQKTLAPEQLRQTVNNLLLKWAS
ncbi:MAG TPA: response regulator [Verrucomicrobiae bacterium]|jgi:CheY-like chemotaxis protein